MNDSEIRADNLKRLRKTRRLLQEDIAEIIGVRREAVSKIETGLRELSISERRLLEWFFFGKEPQTLQRGLVTRPNVFGGLHGASPEWH